jgi:glyoxylase-like metal-dependent hydrolase (beta-lactamase superfamily II)
MDLARAVPRCLLGLTAVVALSLAGLGRAGAQPAPLTLKVITSSESSLYANFTLVMGKTDAVLIDAPFTKADAHRLVADILESGKTLKTIYVTHDHPDHFFSLDVLAEAFPDAQIVSNQTVVDDIWRSIPAKLKRWGPMLGANGPRHPIAPVALSSDRFELEGQTLQVIGPMRGDHVHATAIWIPSIRAVAAGDLVFNKLHPWLGEALPADRKAWIASLDRLAALKPQIVVAGHKLPGLPDDTSALDFTRNYIIAFDKAAARAKTSKALIQTMQAEFPDTQDVLGGFLLTNSAQVATGEAPPWQE